MQPFTKEQKKKLRDKQWRMSHMYKIKGKNNDTLVFKRNEAQEDFEKNRHVRNIILKSRQLGFTTDEVVDGLDDTLTQKNFNMLMISYDHDSAVDIFDEKVKFAWDNLDERVKSSFKVGSNRANTLKLDRGGDTCSFRVRSKGRSATYNRVHVSEFGKICKADPKKATEIISGTIPALPDGARIDFESTAEGEEGYFHDMFWDAWNRGEPTNSAEYKAHFYNWTWDKAEIGKIKEIIDVDTMEQSEKFRKYQIDHNLTDIQITYYYMAWIRLAKDWKLLQQEYPTTPEEAFVSRGSKLFDQDIIKEMRKNITLMELKGEWKVERMDNWYIYESYIPGHRYGLGADVSEGLGIDASTIVIMDFTPVVPKVVAIYKSDSIAPDLFAHEIKRGGLAYGTCLAAVENNNMGIATIIELRKIYPEEMIFSMDRMTERKDYQGQEQDKVKKLGWNTNLSTKPKMFFDLRTAVSNKFIEILCKFCLHELRIYSTDKLKTTKMDEESTNHFDLVTALAICYQMKDHVTDTKVYTMTQTQGARPMDESLGF